MIANIFTQKLDNSQLSKVIEVSTKLNINPNWLLAVIYFETAKTFNPSKTNSIGSVGLIQFTRDKAGVNYKTINGKRYLLSDIGKMNFVKQMDLVYEYYKEVLQITKQPISSFVETYLTTFFPNALGKEDNYIFQTKGLSSSLIAKQNPIFDLNKDGKITKIEVENSFKKWYGDTFTIINTKKKNDIMNKTKQFFTENKRVIHAILISIAVGLGIYYYAKNKKNGKL